MKCPNCNNEIPNISKECDFCGARLNGADEKNEKIYADESVVENLSVKSSDETDDALQEEFVEKTHHRFNMVERIKGFLAKIGEWASKHKRKLIWSSCAPAALIAIIVIIMFFADFKKSGSGENIKYNSAIFVADDKLHFYDGLTGKIIVLSETAISENDAGLYDIDDISVSDNRKTIFFFENKSVDDKGTVRGDLCFKPFGSSNSEATVIGVEVDGYEITDDGAYVMYVKNGQLYEYSVENAKGVPVTTVSDADHIYVFDDNSYAYIENSNSEDSKFGKLYIKTPENDAKFVASDVFKLYDNDENVLYYEKKSNKEFKLSECIENDAEMYTQPEEPEFPNRSDYEDDDVYEDAYMEWSEAYGIYIREMDTYENFRYIYRAFEEAFYLPDDGYSVCLYDGTEEKILSECGEYISLENGNAYYFEYSYDSGKKIKLSQLEYVSEAEEFMAENMTKKWHMISSDGIYRLNIPADSEINDVKSDGSEILYTVSDDDNSRKGMLYSVSNDNGELSEPILVDNDVDCGSAMFADDEIIYTKNFSASALTADYYAGGTKICEDVSRFEVVGEDSYVYFKEQKINGYEAHIATLFINNSGTESKIAEQVTDFYCREGKVFYLSKNSENSCEFYVYAAGKNEDLCNYVTDFHAHDYSEAVAICKNGMLYVNNKTLYLLSGGETLKVSENVTAVSAVDSLAVDFND